ncbi:hypothetical protein [Streptomyces sp. NPDC002490]|uniref:hypothetical protein n=1 Tax=Streptomyces sp. NPDC002490 TaxID=3154416 RepID=UPI003322F85F
MTTTTGGAPPGHGAPVAVARGLLTGTVAGASSAALVVGPVIGSVPLFLAGLGLPALCGLLALLAGMARRAREEAVPPRTALARIEALDATGDDEHSELTVRFDLTVAPDDAPAYRVEVTEDVHRVDLPDHRPGGLLVVQYPPDRPWRVRIVRRPTPAWEDRAAAARIDSAPGPPMPSRPVKGSAGRAARLLALLLSASAVVLLFRADLFAGDAGDTGARSPGPRPSVSATTSAVVVTSGLATVTLGPGQSLLDPGELRRAVDPLTGDGNGRRALTVIAQERTLTVAFAPTGTAAPGFDPRALPYERIPALVAQAKSGSSTGSPQTWHLTASRTATGPLTIRIVVTGPDGTARLEADGRGEVLRHTPAP